LTVKRGSRKNKGSPPPEDGKEQVKVGYSKGVIS